MENLYQKLLSWMRRHSESVLSFIVAMVVTLAVTTVDLVFASVMAFFTIFVLQMIVSNVRWRRGDMYQFNLSCVLAGLIGIIVAALPLAFIV